MNRNVVSMLVVVFTRRFTYDILVVILNGRVFMRTSLQSRSMFIVTAMLS